MASTVKSKPNLYEVLGVTPTATDDEIARAFAREVSPLRPHAIGDLAQITLAYETLRNPTKRRAYDASLAPKPEPAPAPSQWQMPRRDGWPFVASARVRPAERPSVDTVPRPERQFEFEPRPEPPTEPRPAPFVAASPRDPVRADDWPAAPLSQPEGPRRSEPQAKPGLTPQAGGDRALHTAVEERFLQAEDGSIEWKRPALLAGGLFLGVAILGAWLGWEAGNDVDPVQPEEAVTLAVPQARAIAPTTASPPAVAPSVAEARPEPRTRSAAAPRSEQRPASDPQAMVSADEITEEIQVVESPPQGGQAEQPATEQTAAEVTTAALPLPDSVVARTITRIGYACGQVASTTAVEGAAAGVFKVTCTSGDSYRAAPIRGRYHFRRWGRQ